MQRGTIAALRLGAGSPRIAAIKTEDLALISHFPEYYTIYRKKLQQNGTFYV
jgi:hypothetical protein